MNLLHAPRASVRNAKRLRWRHGILATFDADPPPSFPPAAPHHPFLNPVLLRSLPPTTSKRGRTKTQASLQSKLDAADEELKTLRSSLSRAEAKESKAREEHSRKADDMRVKLERTASEVR